MVQSKTRKHAFTLVELLVVIGIIALLISILIPALGRARDKANSVKCASNARQLYIACQMFAQDHQGHLPRPMEVPQSAKNVRPQDLQVIAWVHQAISGSTGAAGIADLENGALWPYIGGLGSRAQVIKCPSDVGERVNGWPELGPRNYSFSMNANIQQPSEPKGPTLGIRLGTAKNAVRKIMWCEELGPNDTYWISFNSVDDLPSGRHGTRAALNAARAQNGVRSEIYLRQGLGNHAFFDGHVEPLSPKDALTPERFYIDRDK